PHSALDRAHDALIGPAAADIRAHVLDNLLAGGLGILLEQVRRTHDLAGLAIAALRHSLGQPSLLHRMGGIRHSPSIVVMDLPPISETCVWHAYARLPSICTMHAPHRPVPQPNLVPVSLRPSRITHNNGVAGGASVDAALLFTVKLVDMVSSLDVTARDVAPCLSCGSRNVPECPISAAPACLFRKLVARFSARL